MMDDTPLGKPQGAKPSCDTGTVDAAKEAPRPTLEEIGRRLGVDKIAHHYYHFYYSDALEKFRDSHGALLEIGIHRGKSLEMWLSYFSSAFVYGIDINVRAEGMRYKIFKADQNDISTLRSLAKTDVRHDVFLVVDDGSHIPEHQVRSFDFLFREVLAPGGVYVIEDVEVSYWSRGGLYGYQAKYGYRHPASIVEIFKCAVDDLNDEFLTDASRYAQNHTLNRLMSSETRAVVSKVCFGKNCIVITKKTEAEVQVGRRDYRFSQLL